jgi:TraU protein
MEMSKLSVLLSILFSLILGVVFDSHAAFFNWSSCLRWRITGICRIVCTGGSCQVWVTVRHWRPDEVSETVNIPGDSIWGESFPGVMASLFDAVGGSLPSQAVIGLSGTGGGGVRTATGPIMDEKFYESHVFGVPWEVMVLEQPFLARWGCEGGGGGLFYVSEPDPLWHNDFRDPGNDPQSSMIGLWGPLYPRQGRAFHGSDVVASVLLSYRAMDLSAGVDGKEIQLGYPTETGCMRPGSDPRVWDYNRGKRGTGGKYLWTYWTPVTCCILLN